MAQIFNKGGYATAPTNSTIGKQINDKSWSRAAVLEAKRQKVFSQMGEKYTQPKNYGDTLAKFHRIPIIDSRNINDQGIDANGVKTVAGAWYAYDAAGTRIVDGADTDDLAGVMQGFSTKVLAEEAAGKNGGGGSIKSGNGNLYGSSKDLSVQNGSFPLLNEEGGILNRVGMKRNIIEAKINEFGIHLSFTKKSLEMDTEKGLLATYSKEIGRAYGELRESQIRNGLIGQSEQNRVLTGTAAKLEEVTEAISFKDLRLMEQSLKEARCPITTELIDGSTKYGTTTVGKARYVYVPSEAIPTLEDMEHNGKNVWSPIEDYAAAGKIADGEIGKIGSFRFIEVEDMPRYEGKGGAAADANINQTNGKTDVFPLLFVGSGSFATVGFAGDVARVTTVMPKADAYNDVYGKRGAVSISWYFGMLYLRPEWILQIGTALKVA